jgi:hypothetical protein
MRSGVHVTLPRDRDTIPIRPTEPMAKYQYFWKCPTCGTELELKMRVTQTRRKCPHCGAQVTTDEIDRQTELRANATANSDLLDRKIEEGKELLRTLLGPGRGKFLGPRRKI